MNKAWLSLGATGVVVVSCSSAPSSPADACNQIWAAICTKLYSCVDAQTIQNTAGYTSQADCVTKLTAQANCVNATCGSGRTYDASNASTCLDDINSSTCSQGLSEPPSCGLICK